MTVPDRCDDISVQGDGQQLLPDCVENGQLLTLAVVTPIHSQFVGLPATLTMMDAWMDG